MGDRNWALIDQALNAVALECGDLDGLLDSIFSFLARRTDFFHVGNEDGGVGAVRRVQSGTTGMGFPPGVAEQKLKLAFELHKKEYSEIRQRRLQNQPPTKTAQAIAEPVAEAKPKHPTGSAPSKPNKSAHDKPAKTVESTPDRSDGVPPAPAQDTPNKSTQKSVQEALPINILNGGECKGYWWGQTEADFTVAIAISATQLNPILTTSIPPMSEWVYNGNKACIEIAGKELRIKTVTGDFRLQWETEVQPDESMWYIVNSQYLVLELTKSDPTWHKCALQGETQLRDLTTVGATKQFSSLDSNTKMHVEKAMLEQQAKQQHLLNQPAGNDPFAYPPGHPLGLPINLPQDLSPPTMPQ